MSKSPPVRAIVAEGIVMLVAAGLIAAAAMANRAWLESHVLPEFFQPRAEQLRDLTIARAVLAGVAIPLLWWVRPWAGRYTVRRTPGELAADFLPTLLAIVLAIGAGEYLLRTLPWFSTHELPTQREPLRRRDPRLGWAYAENRVGRGALGGRTVEYAFDAAGHRVRAPGASVDYAAPSILFVGESIISGHGVAYAESIPGRIEATTGLQAADLAVGGYATDQMYLRLAPEWSRYRQPRALVILFMPALLHRNLEHDRPHLDPGLVWRPPSSEWRLVQVARRLVPYRSDADIEAGVAMTRQALAAMVGMARSRGAVPVILVPQLTPQTAEEHAIRDRVLMGLPYLEVTVDPAWHVPSNRHPDARADRKMAQALAAYLAAHGLRGSAPNLPARALSP